MVEGDILLPHGTSVNVLHASDGCACQVHLNESLFHIAFPATIPLNNSGLKRKPFEFGLLEDDLPGSGRQVASVVVTAVVLPLLIAFVLGTLDQLFRVGLQ